MKFKHINIISDEDDILSDDDVLNITFSKTIFNKFFKKYNIQYFFDINSGVSQNQELSMLSPIGAPAMGCVKDGQPVPLSNLSSCKNRGVPQHSQAK